MANERRGIRTRTDESRDSSGSDAATVPAGIADAATECILAVDDAGTVVYANAAVEPLLGYRPAEAVGTALETLVPPEHRAGPVASWQDAAVVGRRRDGEQVSLRATVSELSDGDASRAVALRPAADLERLSRTTDELRPVLRAAARANSRDELEADVCDGLATVRPYVHAWIGELDYGTDDLVGRTEAGDRGAFVDSIRDRLASGDGPIQRAVEANQVAVVDEPSEEGPLGERAADDGVRSLAAVPLGHDGSIYGVLVVFADRPDAFDDGARAVLDEVGRTVGLAMSALQRRRVLIADSVLEVEFAITGGHPLLEITRDGPTLILEGVVSNTAEEFVFYHTVEGGDPETVVEQVVDGVDRTKRGRVIDDGDEPLIEFVTENPPTSTIISEFGGTKVEQVISDGVSRITAALPHGTDVRELHDELEAVAAQVDGEVELLAQRTEDRTTLSSRQFKTKVTDRLTDRQLATLRTAYFAGYHDRPRTSSGEDVAETLDVSPSTFHQHHRVGVRKLLAAAFERPGHGDE